MEQNKRLSLKEEMENEARRIEEEIAKNPDLEDIEVSDEMEASLLAKIHSYEKKNAKVHEKRNITADGAAEELSEELVPDFSVHTNDGNVVRLSEEDLEALRLGRELLKKKNAEEKELFEVNPKYHAHLNRDKSGKVGKTGKGRIFRMPRKKKLVIALAAVLVLVLGTGMTSVGSKSYLKELLDGVLGNQNTKKMNVKDMNIQETEDGEELSAYREIRQKLGFVPVRLGYKPEDMTFSKVSIDKNQGRALVFYQYNNQVIRFAIYAKNADSSLVQKEEDILINTFEVKNTEQVIEVEEYKKKNAKRYLTNFKYNGVDYELKGVMDKEEFTKILKNLIYFN